MELNQILTECTKNCAEHDGEGFVKKLQVEEIKIDPINFSFVQNERKIREMQILHRMNPLAADKKEEANNNNNNIQLGGWRGGGEGRMWRRRLLILFRHVGGVDPAPFAVCIGTQNKIQKKEEATRRVSILFASSK